MFYDLMITCSEGLELMLADELQSFGHEILFRQRHGVQSRATLETAYRTCLWSRLASRVLLPLYSSALTEPEALTPWIRSLNWKEHFQATATMAVRARVDPGVAWPEQLTALRVKDGYMDYWRDQCDSRPEVDPVNPDVLLYIHVGSRTIDVGLDLSGDSLHKRGLRTRSVSAPLKETLAAALLRQSGWPHPDLRQLIDPMCGSGTLLLEALMLLTDHAPGLQRGHWGFRAWSGHDESLWQTLTAEAEQRRRREPVADDPIILAGDASLYAIDMTRKNLIDSGYAPWVQLRHQSLAQLPESQEQGLIVCNPPYGERLSEPREAALLYQALGRLSRLRCPRHRLTVIAPDITWLDRMGMEPKQTQRVNNGDRVCYIRTLTAPPPSKTPPPVQPPLTSIHADASEMSPWQKQIGQAWQQHCLSGQSMGRIYDQQLTDYPLRIDRYGHHLCVIEMRPMPQPLFNSALAELRQLLGIKRQQIRLGRAGHTPEPDWQQYEDKGTSYLLDVSRSDDAGMQLPLQRLYTHLQDIAPRNCLHLFSHNSTLALQLLPGRTYTQQWEPRPGWPSWARQQWALNGYATDDMALEERPVAEWLTQLPRQDCILLTPPKSHYAEQKRQGFRWRDVQDTWIQSLSRHLSPSGELWMAIDEKSFQLSTTLQTELHMQEKDMLPESCSSQRGHLRFFMLSKN